MRPSPTLPPWDPGLQNERTRLAWQRTILELLVSILVIARLLASFGSAAALALAVLALLLAVTLGALTQRRYRYAQRHLYRRRRSTGGILPVLLAAMVVVLGLSAAFWVVQR